MIEKNRAALESLGWSKEILDLLKSTPEKEAVDRAFLNGTKEALATSGYTALGLLSRNHGQSVAKLFEGLSKVNKWACPLGLKMAIYEEAIRENAVRDVAKDLLNRTIIEAFPEDWRPDDKFHASVKIGNWALEIHKYVLPPEIGKYADNIVRHLTIDHPPPKGWKPELDNDPLINELFDRYWPIEYEHD